MARSIYTSKPLHDTDRALEIVTYAIRLASLREQTDRRAICVISLDESSVVRVHTRSAPPRNAGVVCYFRFDAACPSEALATLMNRCADACRAARTAPR